jgi:hypothetical protein
MIWINISKLEKQLAESTLPKNHLAIYFIIVFVILSSTSSGSGKPENFLISLSELLTFIVSLVGAIFIYYLNKATDDGRRFTDKFIATYWVVMWRLIIFAFIPLLLVSMIGLQLALKYYEMDSILGFEESQFFYLVAVFLSPLMTLLQYLLMYRSINRTNAMISNTESTAS